MLKISDAQMYWTIICVFWATVEKVNTEPNKILNGVVRGILASPLHLF